MENNLSHIFFNFQLVEGQQQNPIKIRILHNVL